MFCTDQVSLDKRFANQNLAKVKSCKDLLPFFWSWTDNFFWFEKIFLGKQKMDQ
jgi:hypothetical protein